MLSKSRALGRLRIRLASDGPSNPNNRREAEYCAPYPTTEPYGDGGYKMTSSPSPSHSPSYINFFSDSFRLVAVQLSHSYKHMMFPYPRPLIVLTWLSLASSAIALIFTALDGSLSPVLWIVPVAFLTTGAYHITVLLILYYAKSDSTRIFSAAFIACTYILSALWMSAFAVVLATTTLKRALSETKSQMSWALIISCVFTLVESGIMGTMAVKSTLERRRLASYILE